MANLAQLFSLDELEQLETEIGARPDEIGDGTGITRAAALVEWAERNDMLLTLLLHAMKQRPDAKWF
jgi:hypothetical protein